MPAASLEVDLKTLIMQAAEWRLIQMLFQCPSPEWKQQLSTLQREVSDAELREAASLAIAALSNQDAAEGAFHSVFGPGGPAPAREASYQGTLALGNLMSELGVYYDAFGYAPEGPEPPDHVSVEAGFLGFLRLKQAFAQVNGESEHEAVAREAAKQFLSEHLAYVAEPLSAALDQLGERYLELAGRALAHRVGPRPKQIFDILDRAIDVTDSSFDCGES